MMTHMTTNAKIMKMAIVGMKEVAVVIVTAFVMIAITVTTKQ